MGKSWTKSEKCALVREWRCSGLSAKEFGSRRGVSVSSLHRWQTELRPASSPRSAVPMSAVEATSARFVVVESAETEAPDVQPLPSVRIELGGLHRIRSTNHVVDCAVAGFFFLRNGFLASGVTFSDSAEGVFFQHRYNLWFC